MKNPVLATKTIPAADGVREHVFRVEGGLHFMRGNHAPYFSLTYSTPWSGGAGHDEILRHFPQFADLAALHLSDIDGVPMHAVENGWYKLAGALGGMGERFHAGNAEYHFPITPPADKPWKDTEYRKPTRDECLKMFADHCRIGMDEARKIAAWVAEDPAPHAALSDTLEAMRERWKAEAAACILKHGLIVYGDPWPT